METQKIVNLLNDLGNKESKFVTRKWYIIDSETKGYYEKDSSIKFIAYWIESSLVTILMHLF